jgi:hypothetical protein
VETHDLRKTAPTATQAPPTGTVIPPPAEAIIRVLFLNYMLFYSWGWKYPTRHTTGRGSTVPTWCPESRAPGPTGPRGSAAGQGLGNRHQRPPPPATRCQVGRRSSTNKAVQSGWWDYDLMSTSLHITAFATRAGRVSPYDRPRACPDRCSATPSMAVVFDAGRPGQPSIRIGSGRPRSGPGGPEPGQLSPARY